MVRVEDGRWRVEGGWWMEEEEEEEEGVVGIVRLWGWVGCLWSVCVCVSLLVSVHRGGGVVEWWGW